MLKGQKVDGYFKVKLHNRAAGHSMYVFVHVLVLRAFVGPRPEGLEACHCNGRRDDNRIVNLRWDTRAANAADRRQHGTMLIGEGHPNAKLTDAQVEEMRRRRAGGESITSLGRAFGVAHSHVSRITLGRCRSGSTT